MFDFSTINLFFQNLSGEYFYSIAALFSGMAYLSGNILWLRILLVCAATVYIISGVSLGITSMVGWNSAYLVINLYHITLLLLDRVTINLPAETKDIYHRLFTSMSTRTFKKLIMMNQFSHFNDSTIIQESEPTDKLYIVLKGTVRIVKSNRAIAYLEPGDLIGEMSFMSNEAASANVIAEGAVECAYWTHADLDKLKLKNRETYNKFISIIGYDLVRKLRHKNDLEDLLITKMNIV